MEEKIRCFPLASLPLPFELTLAGISFCDGTYQIKRTAMDLTVIEYVEYGNGILEVDGTRYEPKAGDVYIIPPWTTHRYSSSAKDPWVKYWFNFRGNFITSLLELYGLSDRVLFSHAEAAGFKLKNSVLSMWQLPDERLSQFAEQTVFHVIRDLAHRIRQATKETYSPVTELVLVFLRKYMMKPMPALDEIAAAAGLSPAQTIRVFRHDTGITPYHYLLQEKMKTAAGLLRETRQPVCRIAWNLGFRDEFYFSRQFRQFYGKSPREFRASWWNASEQIIQKNHDAVTTKDACISKKR